MDASTILSIVISLFSVAISIAFAITGFHFSNKSDKALASIQTKIDSQHDKFLTMIQEERKTHDERFMQLVLKVLENYKGDLPKEKAESLEKEFDKIGLQLNRANRFNSTSVLSKQSKVGEKKVHG